MTNTFCKKLTCDFATTFNEPAALQFLTCSIAESLHCSFYSQARNQLLSSQLAVAKQQK